MPAIFLPQGSSNPADVFYDSLQQIIRRHRSRNAKLHSMKLIYWKTCGFDFWQVNCTQHVPQEGSNEL